MISIRETRHYVRMVAIVLLALDVIAMSILLSPWGRSQTQLQSKLESLQQDLQATRREVGPSRGMDQKLQTASVGTNAFFTHRLPGLYSQIDEALGASAKESGVHLSNVRYATEAQSRRESVQIPAGLRKVNLVLTISGQYVEDVKFINALERSQVFFVIQTVSLAGERTSNEQRLGGQEANVGLQLSIETYLRRGAA